MAGELTRWAAEQWVTELANAIQFTIDEKPAIRCDEGAVPEGECFWWQQGLSCGPAAMLFAGAPREGWLVIGTKGLSAAGIEVTEDGARSTYQEIISQALSSLASALGERAGAEIHCTQGAEAEPPSMAAIYKIDLSFADSTTISLYFAATQAVADVLGVETEPAAPEEEPESEATGSPMDLLLDVELPVSILFGRADVRLQDVLKLNTGSIVELDRSISEPVDIIVNNCVIARGEVVVVEGNYGVRIGEIVSRQERLRTSRHSLRVIQGRPDRAV
jgi:flagellar motor switch protein FliN